MSSSIYVTAAFRSSRANEAYIFMKEECVVENYAPGAGNDKILQGPMPIGDAFPSLRGTVFAQSGIDCAFGSVSEGEAFIFSSSNCAQFYYAPVLPNDTIIKGPMPIGEMFPFLKGTVFESGVDAAFDSSVQYEAYLFKGKQYARISINPNKPHLISTGGVWPVFKDTIFETGLEAAFASHINNEAYIFKGDSYARLKFTPGSFDEELMGGVRKIKDFWQGLGKILPRHQ